MPIHCTKGACFLPKPMIPALANSSRNRTGTLSTFCCHFCNAAFNAAVSDILSCAGEEDALVNQPNRLTHTYALLIARNFTPIFDLLLPRETPPKLLDLARVIIGVDGVSLSGFAMESSSSFDDDSLNSSCKRLSTSF